MQPVYVPRFFDLKELVPQPWYFRHGQRLWNVFDERLLRTLDLLRERWGGMIVNNWHAGGTFQCRGWRPHDSGVGALLSQHRFGRACDVSFTQSNAREVRAHILANQDLPEYQLISCVERGVNWLHFDVRAHDRSTHGILEVWP